MSKRTFEDLSKDEQERILLKIKKSKIELENKAKKNKEKEERQKRERKELKAFILPYKKSNNYIHYDLYHDDTVISFMAIPYKDSKETIEVSYTVLNPKDKMDSTVRDFICIDRLKNGYNGVCANFTITFKKNPFTDKNRDRIYQTIIAYINLMIGQGIHGFPNRILKNG